IRVLFDRPMRYKGLATWDGGKTTWGGRVEAMGTVPVCVCAHESWGEGMDVLAGKLGKESWGEGMGVLVGKLGKVLFSFSPSGDFEIFTLLVPGLWLLSFEGLSFDLLAR
nr:hypothetical protein [Tanacetum cinerariifolium]